MSIGIGGACRKVLEDEEIVIYKYSAYNLNEVNLKDTDNIFDGVITIQKSGLVEPQINEKTKKSTSDTKILPASADLSKLLSKKSIILENCNNCWQKTIEGYDIIGLKLCSKIFKEYQKSGSLPEGLGYDV